jgi:hypothetical protein
MAAACGWPTCGTFNSPEILKIKEAPEIETLNTDTTGTQTVKAAPVQRFERKFAIQPRYAGFALAFLRQVCRPDREYPVNRVTSLYFDTSDLDEYIKSASGEFKKDKTRIRWYDNTATENGNFPVYVELKMREGFASSKQRKRLLVPGERLRPEGIVRGIIDKQLLFDTLAGFGHFPEKPLIPVMRISYMRYRFKEMQTGVRVSYDYNIRALAVAQELINSNREVSLPGGVIEVKGPSLELPVTLRRMHILDTEWSRYSKYGLCIDAYISEPGITARL